MRKSFLIALFTLLTLSLAQVAWAGCNKATSISPTTLTTNTGTAITSQFTASGPNNSPAGFSISTSPVTAPLHGTVSIAANGNITYTPSTGYTGTDSFVVKSVATCSSGKTQNFTINVTVAGCSTPITMQTIPAQTITSGNTLTWAPTGALASGGSGALTYSAVINTTSPSVGSLTFNTATGGFSYAADPTFVGSYSFTITAKDAGACSASQDVSVAVTAPSACSAPNLSNFAFSVPMNGGYSNTSPINGGTTPYSFSVVTPPAHGWLYLYSGDVTGGTMTYYWPPALAASLGVVPAGPYSYATSGLTNGTYYYYPDTGYTGADSFDISAASTCGTNPATTAHASVTVGAAVTYCVAPTVRAMSLTVPSGLTSITITPDVSGGTAPYTYSLASTTTLHGTASINSTTGSITYYPTAGYAGNDQFTVIVASGCGLQPSTRVVADVVVQSSNSTGVIGAAVGGIVSAGAIIIDNTPNPGTPGIVTNMATTVGGKNFGAGNAFSINGIQVMQRDTTTNPSKHILVDESGVTNTASTSYQNYGSNRQTTYFANGQHLFDLDRMRKSANWLRVPSTITLPDASTLNGVVGINHVSPTTAAASCTAYAAVTPSPLSPSTPIGLPVGGCHPAGTYGAITWAEFLDNIKNNRTMYGVVRILVPLQLGKAASSNNALNQTVGTANIYGFCAAGAGEWCANSPTGSTDIKPGAAVAGNNTVAVTIPTPSAANGYAGQIKVRGTLMFDFVNGTTDAVYGTPGHPVDLAHLPFNPRDIYFKVSVAINVNAANDLNGDGILDNIDYINAISSHITCPSYPCTTVIPADGTSNSPAISNLQVPQESIDAYNLQYSKNYLSNTDTAFVTKFNALNVPSQYHMLMGSGYAQGWHDGFAELGITAQQWSDLGYVVPANATMSQPLTTSNIMDSAFEDIPVYLYTGGLVDMHHHMNVAGLIYVPQAAEIEQKNNDAAHPTRMFMMGGLIVRDGFFLEGKVNGMTLISSDPSSYASLRVISSAIQGAMLTSAMSTVHEGGGGAGSPLGVGLSGGTSSSGTTSGTECVGCVGQSAVAKTRWIEIRPK